MGEIKVKYIGAVVAMALVFSIYVGVNAKEVKVEPVDTVEKVVVNQTWKYNGNSTDDPTNPELYELAEPSDTCPVPFQKICEIQAPDDGSGKPDMTASVGGTDVESQIQAAHASLANPGGPSTNATVTSFRSN